MISPITPPFELMNQWYKKACKDPYNGGKFIMSQVLKDICNSAAQWGWDQRGAANEAELQKAADQELETILEMVGFGQQSLPEEDRYLDGFTVASIRAARRSKPPSLRKQACDALDTYIYGEPDPKDKERTYNAIRRALEALPND